MSRWSGAAVWLCAVGLVAGCAAGPTGQAPPASSLPAPEQPSATSAQGQADYELNIAQLGARSSLVPLGLNPDRSLATPPVEQPEQASIYTGGPMPGEPGPAVILGHVNGGGRPGIFAELNQLRAGQTVEVNRSDGPTLRFEVYRVQQVAKKDFPTREVYSDTPGPEVRLITCGGALNRAASSYEDNVIVYARQV